MTTAKRDGHAGHLPEILSAILESRGATISKRGTVWEASLPAALKRTLGVDRVRLVAAPAGRAARGAEMDAALTERILLLGRSHGEVTRLVTRVPASVLAAGASASVGGSAARLWIRLHWRIRYGTDDLAEELLIQRIPLGATSGFRIPPDAAFRDPTADELREMPAANPELLGNAWVRGHRQLESRIRQRLRPHEDRMRRELHREMRTLSIHFRSLIAEERTGRRRVEGREAGRILQLKEDWERKLAAAVRQRALDTEARLVATALLYALPERRG
jgi:hypothetical protein